LTVTTQRNTRAAREKEDCANGSAVEWEKYRHAVAAFYVAHGHFPRRSSRFPSERRLANWLAVQPSTHGLVSPADRLRGALPLPTVHGHPKQPDPRQPDAKQPEPKQPEQEQRRSGKERHETRPTPHFWRRHDQ
jgi:hypothetical protein